MQKYQNAIQDVNGNAVAGATVAVYLYGTTTPATIYSDNGITPIVGNSVTTSSVGEFFFYAANGRYSLTVTAVHFTSDAYNDITLFDPTDDGAAAINFLQAGTGAVVRTVQAKERDTVSVKDFGAVGDGVTDDTAAVSAAQAAASSVYSPPGIYLTTLGSSNIRGRFCGTGQIKDATGSKRGPFFSAPNSAPSSAGSSASVTTAFDGDLTKCQFPVEHRVTGAAAGTPATGYTYTPEIFPHFTYLYSTSGWNQSTSQNDGRTGICAYETKIDNYGQGDVIAYNAQAFVTGTRAGSTNFLANPAAVLFNGGTFAGADGVFIGTYETHANDNGYDVASIGIVNNFHRTNGTGAKSAVWLNYRAQSTGSVACDSMYSAIGKWQVGIDFTMSTLDFGIDQAAISLKSGQRIYFNNTAGASGNLNADWRTTVFNSDYTYHNGSAIVTTVGGVAALQVGSTMITSAGTGGITIASTGALRFTGTGQYNTGVSTALFTATNKPGSTTGAGPAQWLTVYLGGSTYVVPCWAL